MYLKDLVDIQMGQSPESKFYNYDKIGLPFYQGKADFGKINPTPKMWCSKSKKEAKPNDILISVRAPVGDLNINNEQSCIGRGLAAITCKSDVDMMYLYYHLKYLKPQLRHISTGSTFESINRSQLENLIIKYKSYTEQIKISNTLQVVQRQIDVKESLLGLYDLLIKSRFVEMFGDLIINSKCLNTKRLDELFLLKAGITTAPSDILSYTNSSHKYLCYGGNGVRGYVKYFSYSGIFPLIGRQGALCGNVQLAQGDFHATEHAILVKPLVEYVDEIWSYYALSALNLFRYHTGAAQPGISVKTLNNILLPIPILSEQKKFVLFSNQINKLKFAKIVYN